MGLFKIRSSLRTLKEQRRLQRQWRQQNNSKHDFSRNSDGFSKGSNE